MLVDAADPRMKVVPPNAFSLSWVQFSYWISTNSLSAE